MSLRLRFSRLFLAPVILIGALSRPAAAGDPHAAEAEKLIRHGVELRREHDDEAAQREFQKAYDLVHTPRAAGQLGLAEQALGRWEDAEKHVSEAVHASDDAWVAKNRAALDEALNTIEAHLGRVEVIGDPEGAEVLVDGRDVGKLPLGDAVRVSAGQVDIELRAPGYVAAQRTVTIVGGQYQRVVIHLAKEAPPEAEPKPAISPEQPAGHAVPPAATPPSGEPATAGTRAILKWSAAGLAGAGLVTGVVFTILHSQSVSNFENHPCVIMGDKGVLPNGQDDSFCNSTLGTSETYQKVFIAGYVAAGAFAVTWLVLQLTEPGSSPGDARADRVSSLPLCGPAAAGTGLSCAFRF